jgi:cysteinyl-tRNA synthetase
VVGAVLGVLRLDAEEWFRAAKSAAQGATSGAEAWDETRIAAAIAARQAARQARDFKESDEIRDELFAADIACFEGKPGGVTASWRRR